MNSSLHLAPNIPWILFAILTAAAVLLGLWAYRFAIPPLPALARRILPALRIAALVALLWLLAQPIFERPRAAGDRLLVLLDRSSSMELPVEPGGSSRARVAGIAAEQVRRAWRGNAQVIPFATRLAPDSSSRLGPGTTALGDVLAQIGSLAGADEVGAVVVVSDGATNQGTDPVAAARALGIPVHGVLVGASRLEDRAIAGIDASTGARVGRATPVRVRVTSTEPAGARFTVRLREGTRELGRATVVSPGSGAEAIAEFAITPLKPGLALWTAMTDTLRGELTGVNNARQVAVEVAPGRLGVAIVSRGLNWDLGFLRRTLVADSGLALSTWVRRGDDWSRLEGQADRAPGPDALRGTAVVILDGLSAQEVSSAFDAALHGFVRRGGALIAIGGTAPGVARFRTGVFATDLAFELDGGMIVERATPEPAPEAGELLAWDDDPARGSRAWRAAAPLGDPTPIVPGGGDRMLVGGADGGPPLLLVRRIGRGQVLIVNGTGFWRWSLSGTDELSAERFRRLWRNLVRSLSEPVQGEPLRVRPERRLTPSGEVVRLFATLQDEDFHPVAGAEVEAELRSDSGGTRRVVFEPGSPGSYVARVEDLPPGRHEVSARAVREGRELGRAASEVAVDPWSLEAARVVPDSASLAAVAKASGGQVATVEQLSRWTRGLSTRALARARTESVRLWESPWTFVFVVSALGLEWAWRRRRGLP